MVFLSLRYRRNQVMGIKSTILSVLCVFELSALSAALREALLRFLSGRFFFGERADLFELGCAGDAAPFEDGGFGGGEHDAGRFHAAESDFVVDCVARANGIDGDVDEPTGGREVEGGLGDADVGFDATDEDSIAACVAPGVEARAASSPAK